MDINELSDQEKSVMLAKLVGWKMEVSLYNHGYVFTDGVTETIDGKIHGTKVIPNLYDPANMALAWRVLNWANNEYESGEDWSDGLWTWWADSELWRYAPAEAQRLWLDKILSLAIEAGMVE